MYSLKKKMLSNKRKRSESCFFLEKLFNLLEDTENNQIIHWNEDGTKVVISDPIKFTIKIIPNHFKHKNYSSFVRQLNLYGFNKEGNIYNSAEEQFVNENFKKDKDIEDIKKIKRKDLSYPSKEKLSEKKIKEQIIILDSIKKEKSDEKKIEGFKKLIENGNINIKSNIQFLEFLIGKVEEKNIFDEKIRKEISRIKNKNNNLEKKINKLKSKIDNSIEDYNELQKITSHLKETSIKKDYSIQSGEPFTLKKKEKVNDNDNVNLYASFSDELSIHDYSKNPPNQAVNQSSLIVLNKSKFLFIPNINNNENSTNLRQNLTNSILLKNFK